MIIRMMLSVVAAVLLTALPALARQQSQPQGQRGQGQQSAQAPQRQGQPAQVPPREAQPSPAPSRQGQPPASQSAPPLRPPAVRGQALNIQVEVTITDQNGSAPPRRKTVTIVAADGLGGSIRTSALYSELGAVPLNVDVKPTILAGGRIRTDVSLQYTLPAPAPTAPANAPSGPAGMLRQTTITETLELLLDNGRPLVVAQSADPVGDRQVTIEVKATILR